MYMLNMKCQYVITIGLLFCNTERENKSSELRFRPTYWNWIQHDFSKIPESIKPLWKSILGSILTTASDHFDIRGVLNTSDHLIYLGLINQLDHSGMEFCNYLNILLQFKPFKGKLSLVTLNNPSLLVLNTWLSTPLFYMINYALVWHN